MSHDYVRRFIMVFLHTDHQVNHHADHHTDHCADHHADHHTDRRADHSIMHIKFSTEGYPPAHFSSMKP